MVVAILAAVVTLEVTGYITIQDAIANALLFLLALIVIAVLAGVGGLFVGIFFTNRMISVQDFTPFEKEMLAMRQEVKEMQSQLAAIAEQISGRAGGAGPRRP